MEERNIIDLWMKYTYNYNTILIGNNHAPEILKCTTVPEHLADKWLSIANRENQSGTTALLHMWHELDGSNQNAITEWLINNYKK